MLSKRLFPVFFSLLLWSCAAKKPATVQVQIDPFAKGSDYLPGTDKQLAVTGPAAPAENFPDSLRRRQLSFNTLSLKAKGNVMIYNKDNDVTLNLRMLKDKAIWASVTATIAGIEVARAMITPDSIRLVNRADETYLKQPFGYLEKFTGKGISFSMLESLLTGSLFTDFSNYTVSASQPDRVDLRAASGDLSYSVVSNRNWQILTNALKFSKGNDRLYAYYGDHLNPDWISFPATVRISSQIGADTLTVNLNYTKMTTNEAVDMPFSIPKKYKQVD